MLLLAFLLCILPFSNAFADYLLKKCTQSGFCQRNRHYAQQIRKSQRAYYHLDSIDSTLAINGILQGVVTKEMPQQHGLPKNSPDKLELEFRLHLLQDGTTVRFSINECRNISHNENLNTQRYNETFIWAFDNEGKNLEKSSIQVMQDDKDILRFGNTINDFEVRIDKNSFQWEIAYKGKVQMVINDELLMNIEHYRTEDSMKKKEVDDTITNMYPEESQFNMFHDDFQYSSRDTIPLGPESVALDFKWVDYSHLYGIPEHADSFRLKDTNDGGDPYRLYNVDVFQYNIGEKSPMYGSIPFIIGVNDNTASGLFWVNAADTWVDIKTKNRKHRHTHWISENGIIDVVLFLGDNPNDVLNKYTNLTGRPMLPPVSSIGYHQCRWNYMNELDVLTVEHEMDHYHIPVDYIWLDLEYTEDKKYFTWKLNSFPNPKRLLQKLARFSRHLVVLIDPHLQKGYAISDVIVQNNAAILDSMGKVFEGKCWPGTSIWIDTVGDLGRKVWHDFYKTFLESGPNLHIWNDMNEPSIFDGPETTSPKDTIHSGGYEARSVHNLYGLTVHQATYVSDKKLKSGSGHRPFILTRAFFAGSQRTAATWTGDNVASWEYLQVSIPMCLSSNVAGMPFIGADVAGFYGNPDVELVVRWYQAGLWYPFFRAHAHLDSARREPYLFEPKIRSIIRDSIRLRYSLLPTFYSAFHQSSVNGTAIMNPMVFFEKTKKGLYEVEDQFYLGEYGILVKPILHKDIRETTMVFPQGIFYDYYTLEAIVINKRPSIVKKTVPAPLHKSPVYIKGGHIVIRKDKYRRSSALMNWDPYTIVIAPAIEGSAEGRFYIDDGATFNYKDGAYVETVISFSNGILTNRPMHTNSRDKIGSTLVDHIIIAKDRLGKLHSTYATMCVGQHTKKLRLDVVDHQIMIKNIEADMNLDWTLKIY